MDLKWDKIDKKIKMTFFCSFFVGCLVHQFGLVNVLHNIDDIGQFPYGYGTGIMSGRWLLTIFGDCMQYVGGNYNLPYLNGIIYIALIASSAVATVSILNINKTVYAILIGMLFSVFPSATSVLFFRFTSVYYGISFLFSILAVWALEKINLDYRCVRY